MGSVIITLLNNMKFLVTLSCLLAFVQGFKRQRVDDGQCEGTECPAGCCPEVNWYCCPDNMYCAATADDCPFVAPKTKLVEMAVDKQWCDGTPCAAGCCPMVNWYCCPDNCCLCAATAADCPFIGAKTELVKMATKKQCDGTPCPAGCCPEINWYCCPDNLYCA